MRKRAFAAAALVAAAGTMIVAGASLASPSASSAAKPTKSVVKIGLVAPGPGSPGFSLPMVPAAVKAAVTALNNRGGLAGHKVELSYCNDKGDPNQTATCARQLISDKVIMQAGGNILNAQALTPALAKAGIPQLGINAISATELNSPNVFLFGTNPPGYLTGLGWAARRYKVSFVVVSSPVASAFVDGLTAQAKSAGLTVANTVEVSPTQADWAPVVASAAKGGANALVLLLGPDQILQFERAATAAGAPFKAYIALDQGSLADPKLVGGASTVSKNVVFSYFPPLNTKTPLITRFVSEMRARRATGDKWAAIGQQYASSYSAWLAVQVLERLVKAGKVKTLDAAGVTAALKSVKNYRIPGIIKSWSPNAKGPEGQVRATNTPFYLWTFKKGKPSLLSKGAITVPQALKGTGFVK